MIKRGKGYNEQIREPIHSKKEKAYEHPLKNKSESIGENKLSCKMGNKNINTRGSSAVRKQNNVLIRLKCQEELGANVTIAKTVTKN